MDINLSLARPVAAEPAVICTATTAWPATRSLREGLPYPPPTLAAVA